MSFIYNFFYNYSKSEPEKQNSNLVSKFHINDNVEDEYSLLDKKFLISKKDLEKINLKPVDNVIPNPSRNMPFMDKVSLQSLNKAQLDIILNVKLKPIPIIEKNNNYEPRHPVLREILQKTKLYV